MNVSKAAILIVVAAVVAGGAYFIMSSSSSSFDTSYSELLPGKSIVVLAYDSPKTMFDKIDFKAYPNLFSEEMKKESQKEIGFDFTDIEGYKGKGIAVGKPAGFVILDVVKTQFAPAPVMAGFVGVSDAKKFGDFVGEIVAKENLTIEGKGDYSLIKSGPQTMTIFAFKGGYCIFYGSSGPVDNLEEKFKEDILSSENRLAANENFKITVAGLEKGCDGYAFLNLTAGVEITKKMDVAAGAMIEQFIPKGMDTLAYGGKTAKEDTVLSAYITYGEEMLKAYQNEGSCQDILKSFPADPIICSTSNANVDESWKIAKDSLDKLLSGSIKQMIPGGMGRDLPASVDSAIAQAQAAMKEMDIDIDIQKDVILNCQGNGAFLLYNLPSMQNIDFDAALVVKLKDAQKTTKILADVVKAMQGSPIQLQENKIADATVYTFDMAAMGEQRGPKMSISPSFGVFKDYLLITVKKEMFEKVAKGESSGLLDSVTNGKAMAEGKPAAGYLNIEKLVKECVDKIIPPNELKQKEAQKALDFLKHMKELNWLTTTDKKGVKFLAGLKTDEDFLALILKFADVEAKNQKEKMARWEEEMKKQREEWENENK